MSDTTELNPGFDPSRIPAPGAETLATVGKSAGRPLDALSGDVDLADLDLAKITAVSTPVAILHPITKQDTGQRIWLFGKESQRVTDYINGEANAQLRRNADLAARGKDPEPPTVERGEQRQIELLIVATDRWENVYFNGERNAQFSVAKAKELYKLSFIQKQLNAALNDLERFTNA